MGLVHVVKSWELKCDLERFLFLFARWIVFQRLVLLSVHPARAGAPYDQCDRWKRNLRRPNLKRRSRGLSEQVRHRARLNVPKRWYLRLTVLGYSSVPFCSARNHWLNA